MEAYLSKAMRRAGLKLAVGLSVIGALVGIRIVTATPDGLEADLAELERFDAGLENPESVEASGAAAPTGDGSGNGTEAGWFGQTESSDSAAGGPDPDRMVRCRLDAQLQFMRASDCATRGGALEELPPPEPEEAR